MEEEFTITYRRQALAKLKKVAKELGIEDDEIGEVLNIGFKLVESCKIGNEITVLKGKDKYVIDLRHF